MFFIAIINAIRHAAAIHSDKFTVAVATNHYQLQWLWSMGTLGKAVYNLFII